MPDNPVDDFSHRHVLGLGFGLDLLDEGLFNVQGPSFCGSRRLVCGAEEMFPLAPPGKNLLKISEIGQRDVNVDICRSVFVDFGGATVVDIGGLDRKCSF